MNRKNIHSIPAMFNVAADGWCREVLRIASPNCDARSVGTAIDLLVIHNISLPPGQFGGEQICELFTNRLDCDAHPYFDQLRTLRVSSHFLIRRDGAVVQFVSVNERAWHAGLSSFGGRQGCNDFSIGIELEGTDFEPYAEPQYVALAGLTSALQARYRLTDVAGHQHIASGRKTDPGPFFDWQHYCQALGAQTRLALIHGVLRFPA
ncbi:MAG: 1,6-anhydro-N-acetylmuramyl-L-alanine amidase AmpD [Burkholderiaceae bacterium]